mmetsp:Transcript_2111/g.5017  ORF Transcript_2111/g.5017 Transcript_2111/m.5017 type:complete len:302 (-) Transcript_2111:159-1064(-)
MSRSPVVSTEGSSRELASSRQSVRTSERVARTERGTHHAAATSRGSGRSCWPCSGLHTCRNTNDDIASPRRANRRGSSPSSTKSSAVRSRPASSRVSRCAAATFVSCGRHFPPGNAIWPLHRRASADAIAAVSCRTNVRDTKSSSRRRPRRRPPSSFHNASAASSRASPAAHTPPARASLMTASSLSRRVEQRGCRAESAWDESWSSTRRSTTATLARRAVSSHASHVATGSLWRFSARARTNRAAFRPEAAFGRGASSGLGGSIAASGHHRVSVVNCRAYRRPAGTPGEMLPSSAMFNLM